MENQENSGVNTVLIVILLLVVVGGLVWFLSARTPNEQVPTERTDDRGINIDVELPSGNTNTPDAEPTPTPTE